VTNTSSSNNLGLNVVKNNWS
jgi:hypothetical protein